MTTPIIVTRGYKGHTPGTYLHVPDGIAASLIAAGLGRRPNPGDLNVDLPPLPPGPKVDADGEPVEPPRAGPGSTRAAWAAYADAVGVTVDDDATRDEIVAAVETGAPS